MFRYNFTRKGVICAIVVLLVLTLYYYICDPSRKADVGPITRLDLAEINRSHPREFPAKTLLDLPTSTSEKIEEKPENVAEKFFVFSPKCKIPYVDALSKEFQELAVPMPYKECTTDPDLFSVSYNREKRHYTLHLHHELMKTHFSNYTAYACFYYETVAGTNDTFAMARHAELFDSDFVVPRHFLGLVASCNDINNVSRVVQADAFCFAQYPENRNETNDEGRAKDHPNVLLFGIDSMSRMNFHRTMPLTSKFVRRAGWYEMEGYNKVGDNTLPNLVAVLTGRSPKQWAKSCNLKTPGCFNYIPFLWDHFHNAGYMTAYAEDLPSISTFNYLKAGFVRKPVDFYLRPFLMVLEHVLKSMEYLGYKYCLGRRHSYSYVFDYAKQLIQRFVHESPKPLFGLFWTSSLTHDDHSGGANLDASFVSYLEQYKELGLFDKSIVILFSDHGARYGALANHASGFLEERLPMMHIYLPPSYSRAYPKAARALKLNRNRLTSNFDLYLGIRSIVEQLRPGIDFMKTYSCLGCRSIFRVVPRNRGCRDANIPIHWCACETFVPVSITGLAATLGRLVVYRMNKYMAKLNLDTDCHKLYVSNILKAKRQLHFNSAGVEVGPTNGMETFQLEFTTLPNDGKFRCVVSCKGNAENVNVELEEISRLNSYRNESYCVEDLLAKKMCVCHERTPNVVDLLDVDVYTNKKRKVRYGWLEDREDEYDESNEEFVNASLKLNV
ncbi:uncharacterized protein DMAD_11518 [Drosophila madeirensis]|uniref:Uncharacterized protein n=1 Tax=Drosophila madeirensis TaxID=30013 RepID=A0AAU9FDF8_DROMD